MTLETENAILMEALVKACEYIMSYPPSVIPTGKYEDMFYKVIIESGLKEEEMAIMDCVMYFIDKATIKEGDK